MPDEIMETMRAAVRDRYGGVSVIETAQVERPSAPENSVLVRVAAASVNRLDWYSLTGTPYVARPMFDGKRRPKSPLLGTDFAGTIEAVGSAVTDLEPGDEVYGGSDGAFAEYVAVGKGVALKPHGLSFEEAAAVRWRASPRSRGCAITGASGLARRCSSTARPAASARSPSRSRRRSART